MKMLAATLLILAFAGCSISYGKYGLLAVKEPGIRVTKDASTPLEGKSCTRFIVIFPISLGLFHMEDAVAEPVNKLGRPEVVGMADVALEQSLLVIPPFYAQMCWVAKGVAAVRAK